MTEVTKQEFSVAMSVYKNDNSIDFVDAVLSIFNQTYPPNEIILVIDGPVSDTMLKTIENLSEKRV